MRKVILLIILIFISISCGNNNNKFISLFLITNEINVGQNRIALSIIDSEGASLRENIELSYKKIDKENRKKIENFNVVKWPNNKYILTTKINFTSEGYWEIYAKDKLNNLTNKATLLVKTNSKVPFIGDKISNIKTPNTNLEDINSITTDPTPYKIFYKYSLDDALNLNKPIVIFFTTPGLCQTGTCGPQIEEMKKLYEDFSDSLIFIHVEIWSNFEEIKKEGNLSVGIVNKAVESFGLEDEPWTFLINSNGFIVERYQGFTNYEEIKKDVLKN